MAIGVGACRQAVPRPHEPLVPPVSGTVAIDALSAPVRVVRDRWGVPHIYASNQHDLFVAQGFVQAADRLFQMDLWRRAAQGRVSAVLGVNFVERDAMTRRIAFRGDRDADWASYGPDAKAIASAFVSGINAWVARARDRLPEEFVLAGWRPDFWAPEDLLSRTDAFGASGDAIADVLRARLIAAGGTTVAGRLLPPESSSAWPAAIPAGVDVRTFNVFVANALRAIGAPPFLLALAAPLVTTSSAPALPSSADAPAPPTAGASGERYRRGGTAWALGPTRSATGAPIVAVDQDEAFDNPSRRYLVHLHAPGWNVIGAVAPWRPGIAVGHNESVAWGTAPFDADVQDVYVERVNPRNAHQVEEDGRLVDTRADRDPFVVKGRGRLVDLTREYTRHGVVFAVDSERHLAFALRWTGAEPGTAPELGALSIDRAQSWTAFRDALARWKMPPVEFVYADRGGTIARQAAALLPSRRGAGGGLPVPGWSSAYDWTGFVPFDDLPGAVNPPGSAIAIAGRAGAEPSPSRLTSLRGALAARTPFDLPASARVQQDVLAWNAARLVPLLARVHASSADAEDARRGLLAWNRRVTADSRDAAIYVTWERGLVERVLAAKLGSALAGELLADSLVHVDAVIDAILHPTADWFGADAVRARDGLVTRALDAAVEVTRGTSHGDVPTWGRLNAVLFSHPLGVTRAAARRFDVGPFASGGYTHTLMSIDTRGPAGVGGSVFRAIFDVADWDQSVAIVTPGQTGSPVSSHFADLAKRWAAGEYVPLAFSDAAVNAAAESTLTLVPR